MKKFYFFLYLILFFSITLTSQENPTKSCKGNLYFLWGYNRDYYSRSTIHFKNDGNPASDDVTGVYDFKVRNVEAHDRPQFEKIYDIKNITIPQFSIRAGYYFNNSKDEGVEINYDHAKYIVDDWQTVRFEGRILNRDVNCDSMLNPSFFHFEHSDGANFWNFNYMRRWKLNKNSTGKHNFQIIAKGGAGFVLPRTDVTLFGKRVNNNWKIAGACVNLESGFRAEFWKRFVCEFTGKVLAVDYMSCLVQGKRNGKASQKFLASELILTFGWQFGKTKP